MLPIYKTPSKETLPSISGRTRRSTGIVMISFVRDDLFEHRFFEALKSIGIQGSTVNEIWQADRKFLRVTWSSMDLAITQECFEQDLKGKLGNHAYDLAVSFGRKKRLAILVSDELHCLRELLTVSRNKTLTALGGEIAVVISDQEIAMDLVQAHGIRFRYIPVKPEIESRESRLQEALKESRIDMLVLARYLPRLPAPILSKFDRQIITVDNSLKLPTGDTNAYVEAFSSGVKLFGATSHYAAASTERCLIIDQNTVRLGAGDNLADLIRKTKQVERAVLLNAVKLHLQNRVSMTATRCVIHPE